MKKKCCFFALLITLIPFTSWALPTIEVFFDPQEIEVIPGDSFSVQIKANIPDTAPVLSWGLDVEIVDAGIITRVGDPAIGPLWFTPSALDGDGLAGLLFPPKGLFGQGVLLATLTFETLSMGVTDLVASASPGDLTEGFALGSPFEYGTFAPAEFRDASVKAVPIPSTLFLVGTGLVGALGVKRKLGR